MAIKTLLTLMPTSCRTDSPSRLFLGFSFCGRLSLSTSLKASTPWSRELVSTATERPSTPSPLATGHRALLWVQGKLIQTNTEKVTNICIQDFVVLLIFSYLGLFCADPSLQLWHYSFRLRNLCDLNQQPGKSASPQNSKRWLKRDISVSSVEPKSYWNQI